ncbi:hypothetical protein UM91_18375 [Pseudomonas oryzihabitans]|nr:hypothetical protein UM91_18375 [Pseudomonas oryzihabitans]
MNISEALPLLETILSQQDEISEKLDELILTFRKEPEPVEPTLRFLLQPLNEGIDSMSETLSKSSKVS